MSSSSARIRTRAFIRQSGRCYYCRCLMWNDIIGLTAMAKNFALPLRQVRYLQCTAEHLNPRMNGGSNSHRNIVAACRTCNARRHRAKAPRDPISHQRHVQNRMRRKKWHPAWVYESAICAVQGNCF
ncbi:HNH endonuclease [Paraburkholderia phymatum]|uniref:HNH endonuclease n=1 Tax=Paraburkholderia phymatum (strain DSM 17167 / CIP 108236 / LMG 21445 / STM815) TaxID=391038 RepID=B2JW80_PARP8|nr:HNH endonuclease [Paraburkholderia phymatum]ACC75207.1 HNH endonuclease [Paraburkholderia phymatum STM815]